MSSTDTILVFGHKSPDTDSTGSAIIWAWFLSHHGGAAEARLLGTPNTEAQFVAEPLGRRAAPPARRRGGGPEGVIVDTNNPAELPASINKADVLAIIDHHKLTGGIETKSPIEVTMRPVACTATLLWQLMGGHARPCARRDQGPRPVLHPVGHARVPLAHHDAGGPPASPSASPPTSASTSPPTRPRCSPRSRTCRASPRPSCCGWTPRSTPWTAWTSASRCSRPPRPQTILARKDALMASMAPWRPRTAPTRCCSSWSTSCKEEATLLVPNDLTRRVAEASFGATVTGDTVVLPGVMSRKKQIIPALKAS